MKRMACALALAAGTGAVLGTAAQQASADPTSTTATSGLQLSIVPPSSLTSDVSATLDINYRGGNIRSVELYVDNAKVFRKAVKFSVTAGDFTLKLDNSLLSEGDHEVMVVAVDADGSTASSSIKVHVSGPEIDGVAQFAYPRQNAMVQNVVPIELKVDPNVRSPYVSYLLDNDFLAIRNYAPYVYNWDSSKISDGPHTITVEVYDASTSQLLKKMSVKVIVKNVGGFTKIQPTTPTINATPTPSRVRTIVGEAISEPIGRPIEEAASVTHSATSFNSFSLRSAEPQSTSLIIKSGAPINTVFPVQLPKSRFSPDLNSGVSSNTALRASRVAPVAEPSLPGLTEPLAEPVLAPTSGMDEGRIARVSIRPLRAGNIAARPLPRLDTPIQVVKPTLLAQYMAPTVTYVRSHVASLVRTFDVAFNNSRIAFDVQPRVEKGMPLAPFRAIFEHSGGTVQWFAKSQTIRAVSSNRQIEFVIGRDTAVVNNRVIKLAHRPYVDHGRTIVPLTFVRDAMNVKVTYDAREGHLMISDKH